MKNQIKIPINGHFNWVECLWYLDRGYDDCMYKIFPEKVRRAFNINGKKMLIEITCQINSLRVNWLIGNPDDSEIDHIKIFISEWFDLKTDLTPFYELLSSNPSLDYMTEEYSGLRFIGMPDLFESLAWGIIGQQINLSFAYKIKWCMVEKLGGFVEYEQEKYWIFPQPEVIARIAVSELQEIQFSNKKAEYIIDVAQAVSDDVLSKKVLSRLPDLPSRQKMLSSIRGLGMWTTNYVLMKSLSEKSCVPHGDAGLLNALIKHKIVHTKADKGGIEEFFEIFSGWESYMVFYFWRSLAKSRSI